eukprot:m51a1_g2143 putative linker histone h1 and h5 domain containing protein (330) ;mRNA; r:4306-5781
MAKEQQPQQEQQKRVQPPRQAKTSERMALFRKVLLNSDPLSRSTRSLPPAASRRLRRSLLAVVKSRKNALSLKQVLDAVPQDDRKSPSWKADFEKALANAVRAGAIAHEDGKYRRASKKAEPAPVRKTGKGKASRKRSAVVVAKRSHKPADSSAEPPPKRRKTAAKKGATASKTIPKAGAKATKAKAAKAKAKVTRAKAQAAKAPKPVRRAAAAKSAPEKAPRKKKPAKKPVVPEGESDVEPEAAPAESAPTSTSGSHWEYFHNGWRKYDAEASRLVEEEYQKYLADPAMLDVRSVQSGSWAYQVDFVNMKQTNIQHPDHTVRDIRRID